MVARTGTSTRPLATGTLSVGTQANSRAAATLSGAGGFSATATLNSALTASDFKQAGPNLLALPAFAAAAAPKDGAATFAGVGTASISVSLRGVIAASFAGVAHSLPSSLNELRRRLRSVALARSVLTRKIVNRHKRLSLALARSVLMPRKSLAPQRETALRPSPVVARSLSTPSSTSSPRRHSRAPAHLASPRARAVPHRRCLLA